MHGTVRYCMVIAQVTLRKNEVTLHRLHMTYLEGVGHGALCACIPT